MVFCSLLHKSTLNNHHYSSGELVGSLFVCVLASILQGRATSSSLVGRYLFRVSLSRGNFYCYIRFAIEVL